VEFWLGIDQIIRMKPGPKSAADLSLTAFAAEPRLRAPQGLSEDEVDLFLAIVGKLPASFFDVQDSEQLAAYCRHVSAAKGLSRTISAFNPKWMAKPGGAERLDLLLRMREREPRAALAYARSLRLTRSAQVRPETAGRRAIEGRRGASFYETMDDDLAD
jgi:hypothetical protein